MNPLSRSTSFVSVRSQPVRRPSVGSRLSFVANAAERGDAQTGAGIAAETLIEEEIAEIKRYEVRIPYQFVLALDSVLILVFTGLHHDRYGHDCDAPKLCRLVAEAHSC